MRTLPWQPLPRPLGGDSNSLALVLRHPPLVPPPATGGGRGEGGNSLALVIAHPALSPPPTPPPPPPDTGGWHMLSTGAYKPCHSIPPVTGEGDAKSLALVLARPALAPPRHWCGWQAPSPCAHTPCLAPTITTTTTRHPPPPTPTPPDTGGACTCLALVLTRPDLPHPHGRGCVCVGGA